MKKALLIVVLLVSVCASAQIKVTKEGYPKFENKQPTTTVSATDTVMISKVDGIQMGISYADFTVGLGGSGSTYTAGDGLTLTGSEFSVDETFLDGVYLSVNGGNVYGAVNMNSSSIYGASDITSVSGNFDNIISNDITPYDDATWNGSKLVINRDQFRDVIEGSDFVRYKNRGVGVDVLPFPVNSASNIQLSGGGGNGMLFDVDGNLIIYKHISTTGANQPMIFDFNFANDRTITWQDKSGTVAMLDDIAGGGTDNQTLSLSGSENQFINISGGNQIDLTESIQDAIGNMQTGNTESGISVTYDDNLGKINYSVSSSGTDSGQAMSIQTKTDATETFDNSDVTVGGTAGNKRILTKLSGTNEITLDGTIDLYGQTFAMLHDSGAGSTTIKKGVGTVFKMAGEGVLDADGFTFDNYETPTFIPLADNEYLVSIANYTEFNEVTAIYQGNNAADPNNEVNGVAGVSQPTGTTGDMSYASTTNTPTDGSYVLEFTHGATAGLANAGISFTAEIGETYTITFDGAEVTGNWEFWTRDDMGWTTNVSTTLTSTSMTSYTHTTSAATSTTVYMRFGTPASGENGFVGRLDNIVITKN